MKIVIALPATAATASAEISTSASQVEMLEAAKARLVKIAAQIKEYKAAHKTKSSGPGRTDAKLEALYTRMINTKSRIAVIKKKIDAAEKKARLAAKKAPAKPRKVLSPAEKAKRASTKAGKGASDEIAHRNFSHNLSNQSANHFLKMSPANRNKVVKLQAKKGIHHEAALQAVRAKL